ncbi:hypothetical protein BH20VER2_BH20VER2_03840 [soil metagenome]
MIDRLERQRKTLRVPASGPTPPRGEPHLQRPHERGQVIVLLLIVVAMAIGGVWYLYHARTGNEKAVRAFAQHAAERILLAHDTRFLDVTLSRDAELMYPPSWRERMFQRIRDLGPPDAPTVETTGEVHFTSQFFRAHGRFRAEQTFSGRLAYLTFSLSRPAAMWQIDTINFTWTPAPAPPPPADPPPDLPPPPVSEPRFMEEPGATSRPAKKSQRRKRR